jgi:hypothetical protein
LTSTLSVEATSRFWRCQNENFNRTAGAFRGEHRSCRDIVGNLHRTAAHGRHPEATVDAVTDGERVCLIPWGNAGHDPLRGLCQYAEVADVPCTISGSYVRRGKNYVLGNDWTATPGRKETK